MLQAYFDGFEGLEEDFKKAKKEALRTGWIRICPYSDKRYFYPDFEKIEKTANIAWSYANELFGLDPNKRRKLTDEEKEILRTTTPWSQLWKEFNIMKGELERKALNYRIQGPSATQIKAACLYFYKNRTDESQQILNVIHDEILANSKKELLEATKLLLEDSMLKGAYLVVKTVKMKAEAVLADWWFH